MKDEPMLPMMQTPPPEPHPFRSSTDRSPSGEALCVVCGGTLRTPQHESARIHGVPPGLPLDHPARVLLDHVDAAGMDTTDGCHHTADCAAQDGTSPCDCPWGPFRAWVLGGGRS